DVLECFLGRVAQTRGRVRESDATVKLPLSIHLVEEASAIARAKGVPLSRLLFAAWELGKTPLFDREALTQRLPVAMERPLPSDAPPPELVGDERDIRPLAPSKDSIACELALPRSMMDELRAMWMEFDRPIHWLVTEAYAIARGRLDGSGGIAHTLL